MTFAVAHNIGHRSQETGKPVAKIPAYGESEDLAFRVKAPAVNSCRKIEPVNPHVPHREQIVLHLESRHDMILFGNF